MHSTVGTVVTILKDKIMTNTLKDTPMIIPKISPSVDYNWWFKCLGTQLNEPINQNTLKVPKVVKSTNKKT